MHFISNVFNTKVPIGDIILASPTGDGTAILRGHLSQTVEIGPAPGIESATSRSTIKRSTDWANPTSVISTVYSA